jgi:hypothetical protein
MARSGWSNHLSDTVSIVDVASDFRRASRGRLLVGDEPRDIVFAGPGGGRAFITCCARGPERSDRPELTVPGVGRADVWTFDATDPVVPSIVTLFGDTPRALAASRRRADGLRGRLPLRVTSPPP